MEKNFFFFLEIFFSQFDGFFFFFGLGQCFFVATFFFFLAIRRKLSPINIEVPFFVFVNFTI